MVLKEDQERVRMLIQDTISLLCKNGLTYKNQFEIKALIGITLDQDDVFLIDINEKVQTEKPPEPEAQTKTNEQSKSKQQKEKPCTSDQSENSTKSFSVRKAERKRQREVETIDLDDNTDDSSLTEPHSNANQSINPAHRGLTHNPPPAKSSKTDDLEIVQIKAEPDSYEETAGYSGWNESAGPDDLSLSDSLISPKGEHKVRDCDPLDDDMVECVDSIIEKRKSGIKNSALLSAARTKVNKFKLTKGKIHDFLSGTDVTRIIFQKRILLKTSEIDNVIEAFYQRLTPEQMMLGYADQRDLLLAKVRALYAGANIMHISKYLKGRLSSAKSVSKGSRGRGRKSIGQGRRGSSEGEDKRGSVGIVRRDSIIESMDSTSGMGSDVVDRRDSFGSVRGRKAIGSRGGGRGRSVEPMDTEQRRATRRNSND